MNRPSHYQSPYRWTVLVVNFLFLTFAYAGLSTWSIAVPELSKSFNLTPDMTQLGSSMLMAGYALGSFFEALIAARIGFKATGILAAVLLLVPQFLIPFTPSYGLILFMRFVQGWGIVWFVTVSITNGWFSTEQRGLASGINSGAIPFGVGIGGILVGWLLTVVGTWQNAFIYFGVIVLVVAVIWAILAKNPPAEEPSAVVARGPRSMLNPYKLAAGWLVAFCLFMNAFSLIGLYSVMPSYLYTLGLSTSDAGTAILFAGLIGVISTPLGGTLSDWYIRRGADPTKARAYVMAIPGFLVAAVATALFPYIAPAGFGMVLLVSVLAGWGVPLTNASIGSLPNDMLGDPEVAGKLFGLIILVGISGAVISPYLATWIATTMGWSAAFMVLGFAALVGVVLGLIIPNYKVSPERIPPEAGPHAVA